MVAHKRRQNRTSCAEAAGWNYKSQPPKGRKP